MLDIDVVQMPLLHVEGLILAYASLNGSAAFLHKTPEENWVYGDVQW